ncbi:MAG: biotin--[acetyl-CoA-carboxylase] ligase [Clostridia bacterium]|nr:biotin--[acetyl-CoA-carboxylase] ligase [Clostridia bacterium]
MLLKNLKTKFLGKNAIYYKQIDSTQNQIWRLLKNKNTPNGTLVMADIQTNGVGTHDRIWYTDEENNIAFSFFIKMNCNIKKIEGITIKIAQIILEVFKNLYNIELQIKVPNDIVYNGKKLGGILTQTKVIRENVKYLVVGIGINTQKQNFNIEIKDIATSIKKEFGVNVDTKEFITQFCNEFEKEILKRMES